MSNVNQSRKFLQEVCDAFLFYLFVEKDEERQMITKLNEVLDDDEERENIIGDALRYIFTTEMFEDLTAVNIQNWFEEYDNRSIREILTNEDELNDIFIEINEFVNELYETGGFQISTKKNWCDIILCHFLYIYVLPFSEDYDVFRDFINNIADSVICPK